MSDRKPGMFIEMAAARRGRVKIEDQGCTAVGRASRRSSSWEGDAIMEGSMLMTTYSGLSNATGEVHGALEACR